MSYSYTNLFHTVLATTVLIALTVVPCSAFQTAPDSDSKTQTTENATSAPAALDFTMKSIDGEDVDLSNYHGNVILFVNVASKCGYTKQYEQLQQLHQDYAEQGLSVVGVPCNQFGGQEPGSEAEIAEFCSSKFGVEFDLLAKVDVKGSDKCELYDHLTNLDLAPVGAAEIKWNFEKIIVNRMGEPIGRFDSKTKPDSDEMIEMLETALAEKITPYSHESKKLGKSYYLFKKEIPLKNSDKIQTIYFFAKDPNNEKGTPMLRVPNDRVVSETKTGMLVLKKKK
jgi:glutathione peroxidase